MISLKLNDKIIETSLYKDITFHNVYEKDKLICSIRKANIEGIEKSIVIKDEYNDDINSIDDVLEPEGLNIGEYQWRDIIRMDKHSSFNTDNFKQNDKSR